MGTRRHRSRPQAWLNIIGILIIFLMANPALKALRDYEDQRKRGVSVYTFDPEALGIPHARFWVERNGRSR